MHQRACSKPPFPARRPQTAPSSSYPSVQSLVLWILSEVTNPRLGVDWNAHVGGGLCGFVFGSALSFLRMHLPTENEIARTLSLLAVLTLLLVRVFHWLVPTPSEALRRMGTSRHQPRRASTFLQRVRHRSRTWGHRVSKCATRALKAKPLASCGLLLVGLLLLLAHALLPAAAESTCGQAGFTKCPHGSGTVPAL